MSGWRAEWPVCNPSVGMCGWVCTLAVCVCLLSQGWYLDNQATSWFKIEKTNSTSRSHISEPRAETADLQNQSFGLDVYMTAIDSAICLIFLI